jgi:hypothetical protein
MGVPLCAEHFVERLTAIVHFSVSHRFPRFPHFFEIGLSARRCAQLGNKGHGADKFSAESPATLSPFHELIRESDRRAH